MPSVRIEINGELVDLPEEILHDLVAIAERNRIPVGEAIAQAIANEKFLEDEVEKGGKLLIEKGDSLHHLVFEPA